MSSAGAGVDLKNPEEVKQYIENLGIEYRFGCYKEKDPKGKNKLTSILVAWIILWSFKKF